MALKRRRTTSPSGSVSGGNFDDSQTLLVSLIWRKRRRTSNVPTVDSVILQISATVSLFELLLDEVIIVRKCAGMF